MELMQPQLLRSIITKDQSTQVAVAILHDHCQIVLDQNAFQSPKINLHQIKLAKQLWKTGLFKMQLNFDDYRSVHQFIVKNANFLDANVQSWLLAPFS